MHILKKYIITNKYMSIIAAYFAVSIVLKVVFSIDILIPCLWKKLFLFECPGCGLTTAYIKLITLDISGAQKANTLIFIIFPSGVFYAYNDFVRFKRNFYN